MLKFAHETIFSQRRLHHEAQKFSHSSDGRGNVVRGHHSWRLRRRKLQFRGKQWGGGSIDVNNPSLTMREVWNDQEAATEIVSRLESFDVIKMLFISMDLIEQKMTAQ